MSKILVAYYSQSGHTAALAKQIAKATNATLYQITVGDDVYPADMDATDKVYKQQVQSQNFPALTNPIPDLSQYDLILIGGPVWEQTMAGPVISFINQLHGFIGQVSDFSSAFSSTGNYEQHFKDLAHANHVAVISDGLHINGSHANQQALTKWLQQLQ